MGSTRSGKSHIVNAIAQRWSRFLAFDPKAEPQLVPPNTRVVRSGAAAAAALPGRVMYHPPIDMDPRAQRADFDTAVRVVLTRRGCGIAVHEGSALVTDTQCGPHLNAAVMQGAGLGIPMVYAFQEPVRIWRPFLTQATVVIVLYLGTTHRETLARELSAPALAEPLRLDHSFLLWRRSDPERVVHSPPLA